MRKLLLKYMIASAWSYGSYGSYGYDRYDRYDRAVVWVATETTVRPRALAESGDPDDIRDTKCVFREGVTMSRSILAWGVHSHLPTQTRYLRCRCGAVVVHLDGPRCPVEVAGSIPAIDKNYCSHNIAEFLPIRVVGSSPTIKSQSDYPWV